MFLVDCVQRFKDVSLVLLSPECTLVADGLTTDLTINTQLVGMGGAHLDLVARRPTGVFMLGAQILHILQSVNIM